MTNDTTEIRGYRGQKLIDWHKGSDKRNQLPISVPFLALSRQVCAENYGTLENREQREGFFDNLLSDIDRSRSRWAVFYSLAELLQREEWYWRAQGFENFTEFWRARTGQTFAALAEMEQVYRYAQMADPDLFDLPYDQAAQAELIARLQKIRPSNTHGAIKGGRGNRYTTKTDVQAEMVRAAAGDYEPPPPGNGIRRRFARLRRDHPEVANRMLAGEDRFFNTNERGCQIKWKEVEKITGKPQRSGHAESKNRLAQLDKLLRTRDERFRNQIADRVRNCKWLEELMQMAMPESRKD